MKPTQILLMRLGFGCLFVAPFLMGYGVRPVPSLINEVLAVVGLCVLLLALPAAPVRLSAEALFRRPNYRLAQIPAVIYGLMLVWQGLLLGSTATPPVLLALSYPICWILALHVGWSAAAVSGFAQPIARTAMKFCLASGVIGALICLAQYFELFRDWPIFPAPTNPGRAMGLIRHPNHQAIALAMALASCLSLAGAQAVRGWVAVPCCGLLGAAMLATGSRMGLALMVLCCFAFVIVFAKGGANRSRVLVYAAVALFGAALLAGWDAANGKNLYFWQKVAQTSAEGLGSRVTMWSDGMRIIGEYPVWGVGIVSFVPSAFLMQLNSNDGGSITSNLHNIGLQTAAEIGVPAAFLIFVSLIWLGWRLRARPWTSDSIGVAAILSLLVAHAMLEMPQTVLYLLIPFAFWLGVLINTASDNSVRRIEAANSGSADATIGAHSKRVVIALIGLAAALHINVDHHRAAALFLPGGGASEVQERIRRAESTWWFRHWYELARAASLNPKLESAEYVSTMQRLGCFMAEPWFYPGLIVALAEQGRIIEAARLYRIQQRVLGAEAQKLGLLVSQISDSKRQQLLEQLNRPPSIGHERVSLPGCARI